SGNFNYTIPLTGTGCTSLNATGTITVVTACGSVFSVSDIDGNPYSTVSIGNQCSTKENLRVRRYNDNTEIKFDKSGGTAGNLSGQTWSELTYGAHTLYEYDSTGVNSSILGAFGYLYNWYAAKGIATTGSTVYKNICPTGWHVPTDSAWTTLTTYLGGESVAGGKMKLSGTDIWNSPNTFATNESGFSALPGGYRKSDGSFSNIRNYAFFWSATENDTSSAWFRNLYTYYGVVYSWGHINDSRSLGASVRCLKD
ncbi:MAG: fibrobacter succinogenes major paralogous domain-containing protein, partial [Haliscomenobacter sp.]|nr:fibrobacter succinogenes major paralogous domain-containing protein [Haliscomenobacter sp.]